MTLLDRNSVLMQRRALGRHRARHDRHVGERYRAREGRCPKLLAEAFLLYAAPQLDGQNHTIQDIHTQLKSLFGTAAEEKRLLKRIADLYPFVSLRPNAHDQRVAGYP